MDLHEISTNNSECCGQVWVCGRDPAVFPLNTSGTFSVGSPYKYSQRMSLIMPVRTKVRGAFVLDPGVMFLSGFKWQNISKDQCSLLHYAGNFCLHLYLCLLITITIRTTNPFQKYYNGVLFQLIKTLIYCPYYRFLPS